MCFSNESLSENDLREDVYSMIASDVVSSVNSSP